MSDHDHPDHSKAPETQDVGSQALAEALHSSFTIVKIAMGLLIVLIFAAGFFTVNPGEKAVILRFGKPVGEGKKMLLSSGTWYWSFPYPIDDVVRIPIAEIQKVTSTAGWYAMSHQEEVAYETLGIEPMAAGQSLNPAIDGYVLTADTNVIHTRAVVSYHIDDPLRALFFFASGTNHEFNLNGVSNAVLNAANNALVASAARFDVDDILTRNIAGFQDAVRHRVDELVDREQLGIIIDQCQVVSVAPRQLAADFRQVTAAQQERDKAIQDALGLQSRILNEAGAQAFSITNAAESARKRYVTSIQADAAVFTNVLAKYEANPVLYRQLAVAGAMSQILTNVEKDFLPQRGDGKPRELRLQLNREPLQPKPGAGP